MKKVLFIALLVFVSLAACNQLEETTEVVTEAVTEVNTEEVTEAVTTETETAVEVDKGEIDMDALRQEGKPILLQFSQDGCPPCEQMLPLITQLQEEYEEDVLVRYVDVHANMALATDYQIRMTPTQIFIDKDGRYYEPEKLSGIEFVDLDDGTRVVRHVGLIPEDLLRTYLDALKNQ